MKKQDYEQFKEAFDEKRKELGRTPRASEAILRCSPVLLYNHGINGMYNFYTTYCNELGLDIQEED